MLKITGGIVAVAVAFSGINFVFDAAAMGEYDALTEITYNYDGSDHTRMMESLGRGLVAVNTEDGVFLSWRMLGNECSVMDLVNAPDYILYKNGKEIAKIEDSTNYLDADGTIYDKYSVAIEGGDICEPVSEWQSNYTEIPLEKPEAETVYYQDSAGNEASMNLEFSPADTSCGDLDGDGEYELIVKWVSAEKDVGSPGEPAYSGTVRFSAYELDGTKFWDNEINLGKNVYSSAHTVQFLVYDFDGDGKAEMICQTSLGSKDTAGNYVSNAADPQTNPNIYNISDSENENIDYRRPGYGLIIEGEEFLTVFNGETGEAVDTINLPTQRVSALTFGDNSGNRCNRFIADVAYLDGINPYAVYWRGYYTQRGNSSVGRTAICGVKFENGRLSCEYNFDTYKGQPGYVSGNEKLIGNGNHNMTVADVDDDGMDEVISGSLCVEVDDENNFVKKWCAGGGHGDALHIGDYDPTHKGLEYFTVHESVGTFTDGTAYQYGQTVMDPATGEILFHADGTDDTGRGLMANVGMGGYYQTASSKAGKYIANGNGVFGEAPVDIGQNFRIFWDSDLYEETLNHPSDRDYTPQIYSWNGSKMEAIFSADGCTTVNGTKAVPCLQADLFGDWREEIVVASSDGSSLRVYTTTDLTKYKLPTLMHDPVYRSGIAAEQSAYNQPPHVGFYLSEEIFNPRQIGISIVPPVKTEYNVGEELDITGLKVIASYNDGTTKETEDYSVVGYDKTIAGIQTVKVVCGNYEESVEVKVNTDFICDEDGNITGYNGNSEEAIIPSEINSTAVTGIAAGALEDTSITVLYVYDNVSYIGENSFLGIELHCYEGSAMYEYAVENGLNFILEDRQEVYYEVNDSFSEDKYNGFVMLQTKNIQSQSIGGIVYTVNKRDNGGDNGTGFEVVQNGDNKYLVASNGRFGNPGRHAYMSFSRPLPLTNESDNVLAMKVCIPSLTTEGNANTAYLEISDSNGTIDTISASNLGIENDTWYEYRLIYNDGAYYRFILDESGNIISIQKLNVIGSEDGITEIAVLAEERPFNSGSKAAVYIDDFQLYTVETAISDVNVTVSDENGIIVSGAEIAVSGLSMLTDADGEANFIIPSGFYDMSIKANGYEDSTVRLLAYKDIINKSVVMLNEKIEPTAPVSTPTASPDAEAAMPYTLSASYNEDGGFAVSAILNEGKEPIQDAKLYIAQYHQGRLLGLSSYPVEMIDEEVSVDIMESADCIISFIWDKDDKPCAEYVKVIR